MSSPAACSPSSGAISPTPLAPHSSSTFKRIPVRTPPFAPVVRFCAVGITYRSHSAPATASPGEAVGARPMPNPPASIVEAAPVARAAPGNPSAIAPPRTAARTALWSSACSKRLASPSTTTSTTPCRLRLRRSTSARERSARVVATECSTRMPAQISPIAVSGGVRKSCVSSPSLTVLDTGKKSKMRPPPLLMTTTATGGRLGRSRNIDKPFVSCMKLTSPMTSVVGRPVPAA
mmetsp:Transcript_5678/g.22409  ORF Transcript_5678/g.22409 Transcript_5678/m.22409 type:complete len:234 (-) Transcript_5678:982-1683(-)